MEKQIKHLEFIQQIVERMSRNSFLLKGWALSVVTALSTIIVREKNVGYLIISIVSILGFWILDAYYLKQEKLFRDLYDKVRLKTEKEINFSLKTVETIYLFSFMFSLTLFLFYFGILVLVVIFYISFK